MPAQDFDKLDGILKDYKRFMSECPLIDRTLPTHVNLDGFSNDGLKIHVHVCRDCRASPDGLLSPRHSADADWSPRVPCWRHRTSVLLPVCNGRLERSMPALCC